MGRESEKSRADYEEFRERGHPNPDYIRMYYQHQYERFAKLEQYGFTVSNFAVGVSLFAFGAILKDTELLSGTDRQALAIVTAMLNFIAGIYLLRVYRAKRSHQDRAKAALKRWAHALYEIDERIPQPNPYFFVKRSFIQGVIHIVLIVAAMAVLYHRGPILKGAGAQTSSVCGTAYAADFRSRRGA